jgi:adenylate kinase family enzyme
MPPTALNRMKILIFGNSGSGKSTLAKAMAAQHAITHLDLDTIVWMPEQVGVQRPRDDIRRSLRSFMDTHNRWIIEGCYGELVQAAAPECGELVFLNPGGETCVAHNRHRPWAAQIRHDASA